MLKELVESGYGIEEDYNCAETILAGANIVYNLGLDKEALKLAAGFGGGMAIESVCGALTGGIMVMGTMFVQEKAHESSRIKKLTKEFFQAFEKKMGSIECTPLKGKYRTKEEKCYYVKLIAAEVLDEIIANNGANIR